MTMAAHSPYDFKLAPQRQARGAPFGNDAETDEYLRRLTFAQEDYRKFLDDLGAVGRPVLATQFGDHHPVLTRAAFERAHVAADASDWRGKLYDTFYAVTPVNFTPAAPLPSLPSLDIAYLGGVVLDVAGIPLDPVMADKRALRAICDGAFHTCADRAAVNRHLARMQSSGYLREPDVASDPRLVAGVDAD
jgi:hypothetical protein